MTTDNRQKSRISFHYIRRLRKGKNRPAENTWSNHVKMSSISDLSKTYNPKKLNKKMQENANENAAGVHRISKRSVPPKIALLDCYVSIIRASAAFSFEVSYIIVWLLT